MDGQLIGEPPHETPPDSIEDRVYLLVSKKRGTKRAKLSSSTRLNQDLGMDGDDAVEFFDDFQQEFRVDLSELMEVWPEFFGTEGVSLTVGVAITVCIVGCIWIARYLESTVGVFPRWAWTTICIAGFLVSAYYYLRWRRSPFRAITIADLIGAARAGKWPRLVEQKGGAKRSYR